MSESYTAKNGALVRVCFAAPDDISLPDREEALKRLAAAILTRRTGAGADAAGAGGSASATH